MRGRRSRSPSRPHWQCLPVLVLLWVAGLDVRAESLPHVTIETELGTIEVEVNVVRAPLTATNFLRYVDAGLFRETSFYRVVHLDNDPGNSVKIEVIQGGRSAAADVAGFPPIAHEPTATTGLHHLDGVVSMARLDPGSASSEFFVCVADQPELDEGGRRNPDGAGFAAFGRVVKGADVVRAIHRSSRNGQSLSPRIAIHDILRLGTDSR
ncbi:MAG: peptidylprolyl isomerase [Acidobacteriota bacterium]|nr:peptidylprolyl isomerase [Acidobacteriota bacterium]